MLTIPVGMHLSRWSGQSFSLTVLCCSTCTVGCPTSAALPDRLVVGLLEPCSCSRSSPVYWRVPSVDVCRRVELGELHMLLSFFPSSRASVQAEVNSFILIICQNSAQICFIFPKGRCSSLPLARRLFHYLINCSGLVGIKYGTGLQYRFCGDATPIDTANSSTLLLRAGCSDTGGNSKSTPEVYYSRASVSNEILLQHISGPQERWRP